MKSKLTLTLFAILTMLFVACGEDDINKNELVKTCDEAKRAEFLKCNPGEEITETGCQTDLDKYPNDIISACGNKMNSVNECHLDEIDSYDCTTEKNPKCQAQEKEAFACIFPPNTGYIEKCENVYKQANCDEATIGLSCKFIPIPRTCTTESLAYINCLDSQKHSTCEELGSDQACKTKKETLQQCLGVK